MKTPDLEKLIAQATPLPWSLPQFAYSDEQWAAIDSVIKPKTNGRKCGCKYMLCDSLMGAIATVHNGDKENAGDDPTGKAAIANARVLHYAVNSILPMSRRCDELARMCERLRLTCNPLLTELRDGNESLRLKVIAIQKDAETLLSQIESEK